MGGVTPRLAGIVLAGGVGRRLGGADKPAIAVGGTTLLDRALAALAGADETVVVGPRRATAHPVSWTREDPPRGGPVAALAAGMAAVPPRPDGIVAVLAADLLGVRPSTIARLTSACLRAPEVDGAVLLDAGGRRQWLVGVWRDPPLRAAVPADPPGRSLRSVLGALRIREVAELPGESADVDTAGDLRAARAGAAALGLGEDGYPRR